MKKRRIIIAGTSIFFGIVVVGVSIATSGWYQCRVCGVQQYERTICGIVIESWCEREYDEYGSYADWRAKNGRDCVHVWREIDGKNEHLTIGSTATSASTAVGQP